MHTLRMLGTLTAIELKLFFRVPIAIFFALLFPIIPLLALGTAFGSGPGAPGFRIVDHYVPGFIGMQIGYLGLMAIPMAVSQHRENGVVTRLRVSPLSASGFLVAQVAVQLVVLAMSIAVIVLTATAAFGVRFGGHAWQIGAVAAFSGISMFSAGFALLGLFSTVRTAQAAGSVAYFLMMFASGAALPRLFFPPWLHDLTDYLPLTHVVDTLNGLWIGQPLAAFIPSFAYIGGFAVFALLTTRLTFHRWQ